MSAARLAASNSFSRLRSILKSEITVGVLTVLTIVGLVFGSINLYDNAQQSRRSAELLRTTDCGTFTAIGNLDPGAIATQTQAGGQLRAQLEGIVGPARKATHDLHCPPTVPPAPGAKP